MKQSEIDRRVARATGESRKTIAHYGFQLDQPITAVEPCIGLNCPGCGQLVSLNQDQSFESRQEAECLRCDAYYPVENSELFLTEPADHYQLSV